jgi:hypothetical protein
MVLRHKHWCLIKLSVVCGCHSVYGVNTPEHLIKRQITRQLRGTITGPIWVIALK